MTRRNGECLCLFKQKTAYELRISDWSSDVCSTDLLEFIAAEPPDQPLVADRALKPLCDLLEQFVAGLVAERVVDRLEAIEIEQEQRGRAIGAPRLGESLIERPLHLLAEIGRASCRERVCQYVSIEGVAGSLK